MIKRECLSIGDRKLYVMENIIYSKEKMEKIQQKVQELINIVRELETDFPGRHFTLDGHLVGSIGEVMAAYYYGIELYKASVIAHDGESNGRRVQIKITQQNSIVISHEPEYLIVFYLKKDGQIFEVYNGPGKPAWDIASKRDSHNNRHLMINKLMQLDQTIQPDDRIGSLHTIEKMKNEYKNVR